MDPRLPIPNILGDERENWSTGGGELVGCSASPMIIILMRVSLPSKLGGVGGGRKRGGGEGGRGDTHAHIHSHTIVHACTRTNAVLW